MPRSSQVPQITLLDDVEKCEKEIVERLLSVPDGKPVRLMINSGGGSVYSSLAICTVLKMKKLKAEAVVLADCSSSALMIFAACRTRRVAPHASFLFHPMRWTSEEQARLSGAKSWSTEFNRVNAVCEHFIVENLGIPLKTLRLWTREERYIQAQEMFDLGLAEPLDLAPEGVIDITARARRRAPAVAARPATRLRKTG